MNERILYLESQIATMKRSKPNANQVEQTSVPKDDNLVTIDLDASTSSIGSQSPASIEPQSSTSVGSISSESINSEAA